MGATSIAKYHDALVGGAADNGFAQLQIKYAHVIKQAVGQEIAPCPHLVAGAALGLQFPIQTAIRSSDFIRRGRRKTSTDAGKGRQTGAEFPEQGHAGRHHGAKIPSEFVASGVNRRGAHPSNAVAQAVVAGSHGEQEIGRQLIVGLREGEAGAGRDFVVVAQRARYATVVFIAASIRKAALKLAAAL